MSRIKSLKQRMSITKYEKQLGDFFITRETCPICKKRITKKIWNTQEPLHLYLEHSLGGEVGSWGDNIIDVLFCSRKCFDKIFNYKNLQELDTKINAPYLLKELNKSKK